MRPKSGSTGWHASHVAACLPPRYRQLVRLSRKCLDMPLYHWHEKPALLQLQVEQMRVQPLPQTVRAVRIKLASTLYGE
jgi:hypothetical protein